MKWNIALLQMDIHYGDPDKNKEKVKQMINEASKQKVDLVILPELWSTGYDLARLEEIATLESQDIKDFLSSLAKEYQINIHGGSVAHKTKAGIANTTFIFNRNGEIVGDYSKLHLIRLMHEDKYLIPGEKEGVFEIEGTTCGTVICYDIRFPEWLRKPILSGANVLFVAAEWPLERKAHWRNILVTRAIENQCYVVACNSVGKDPDNVFAGHSMIVDPWGEIIVEGDENEGVLYGSIDVSNVTEIRKRIPIFEDRRPALY